MRGAAVNKDIVNAAHDIGDGCMGNSDHRVRS